MSNNLDNLFKKALHDRSCEPPPYIWKNIERKLDGRRNRIGGWWFRGIAATGVIALALWFLQLEVQNPMPMQWVDVPFAMVQSPIEEEIHPISSKTIEVVNTHNTSPVNHSKSQETIVREKRNSIPIHEVSFLLSSASPNASIKREGIRKEIIPIVSGQALKNNQEYNALLNKEKEKEQKRNSELKIALSGHVAPIYSSGSYRSSATNTRGYSYSRSQMNGMMNVSGGLKLSVATNKRLSIQTGIFYSRMGQHTDEKEARPAMAAFASSAQPEYDYVVTPLGNLKNRTKAVSYRSQEAVTLSKSNNQLEGIEQVFNTVEIPLAIRYRVYDNKVGLSISGGISGNVIVDNKVYMIYANKKEHMGSTEDIRRFNLSTDLGIGIEYPLSPKVKIMLEPGFKYYVQSLSQNSQIDFKPYSFSLATGIGIEF